MTKEEFANFGWRPFYISLDNALNTPRKCSWIYLSDGYDVWVCQFTEMMEVWKDCSWSYVYMPDPPKRLKLLPSETLKGCSNNYILELEERIERLEKAIQED